MVEYKKLGEVCSFNRGKTITAKNAIDGDVPVIAGGQTPSYYHNQANRNANVITVAGSGAYAGFVAFWDIPIYVSDAFTVDPNESLSIKYLFYYLKNNQNKIFSTQKGAGVPHVHGKDISNFIIPVPSLSEQSNIVSILDTFNTSIENLKAQLEQRKKQYVYFRNKILSFDNETSVKFINLKELFDTRNGYTPSTKNEKFWTDGSYPWFKMEDLREKGRILSDSNLHITKSAIKGKGLFKANSIIIATSATIGEHALITVEHLSNQRFTNIYPKKEYEHIVNMKFMYYYMFIVDEWCKQHVHQGGFASVDMEGLYKLPIPLPSSEIQDEIVSTLDAFEESIKNLEQQIELRQKQYEYYRNKLLTFE